MAKPRPSHAADQRLAEAIRLGSEEAFEQLFRMYYTDLVAFARAKVYRQDVAEECVQDLFCRIWQQRATWQPRGSLRPYLFAATHHHASRHLKRERTWLKRAPEVARRYEKPLGPETVVQAGELRQALDEAVAAMPERRRLVFVLSRHHGFTYPEIAAMLDITVHAVEMNIVRALKYLRKRLARFRPQGH